MTAALVAGAVVAITVGIIAAVAVTQGGSSSPTAASATTSSTLSPKQLRERDIASSWSEQATAAFGGSDLTTQVATMVNGLTDFKAGKLSAPDFAGRLVTVATALEMARDRVSAIVPFPLSPLVKDTYLRAAELYVEAVHLIQQEVVVAPSPLADQTALAASRVRELGDRVFDRGRTIIDTYLREPTSPDVEIRLPEEVPEWGPEGLAAGPPLEPVLPPPAAAVPPTRQATRPIESPTRWLHTVHSIPTPSAPQVADAIQAADGLRLRAIADELQAAADRLRAEPDPRENGGREESARYRLALLVREEAVHAAQLMVLASSPQVSAQFQLRARRLLLVSDGVGPTDLHLAPSGLDPSLLLGP